jgi:hypothetical protein
MPQPADIKCKMFSYNLCVSIHGMVYIGEEKPQSEEWPLHGQFTLFDISFRNSLLTFNIV